MSASSSSETILAFDIGIRNLAWCVIEKPASGDPATTGPKPIIHGWQNYDLLSGRGSETPAPKVTCHHCKVKAAFWNSADGPEKPTCLRHCPAGRPPLKDLSGGTVYKSIPSTPVLRTLAAAIATTPLKKSTTRAGLLDALLTRHSLPIEKVKVKKAVEHDLALIHDAIRAFVLENRELFARTTRILLENQPVLKNPTMKSVQILLFATLRDCLQPSPPPLKLVHAGKKVKGTATGDAGYKSRKDASEGRTEELLSKGCIGNGATWLTTFKGLAKRSDLADAFCMCCDALGVS